MSGKLFQGKSLAIGKENVFDEVTVKISGGIELRGSRCNINTNPINFKPNEKILKSNWTPSSELFIHSIRLEFEPAHSGVKVLGVGAQYAVDSDINGCEFSAHLRISDETGNRFDDRNDGRTLNRMNNKAVFLGAQAEPGEIIRVARFDVIPKDKFFIFGFYINSLRLNLG